MYFIILLIFLSNFLFKINADMHCLVARPGFGLISEVCPLHTVGCRIRIEKDAVSFYEYSRLYDRNQFVCVLKGEFGEQKGSGCARKRSGHIRCWCFGRSNCNTPENSKLLYLTFIGGNEEKFKKAVESVDFVDLNNEEGEEEKEEEEEKFLKNKNWEKINITTTLSSAVIREDEELINGNIKILNNGQEEEGGGKILKLENVLYETSDIKKAMGAKTVHLSEQFVDDSFTKSTQKLTTLIPTNTQKTATTQKTLPTLTTTPKLTEKPFLHPSTVKSIYDSQNRVHVIHVSGRDRYDNLPVEQLLGSPALRRIMEEEREKLKNKVEDNSAEEEEEEEGEGDNLDEDEELEEDWEFEKNNGEEEEEEDEEDLFKRTINNKTKITERRSSSLSNTKISKKFTKKFIKNSNGTTTTFF
uniref:Uncharacterized protein n=1 Tax=Meloidogyne enterolobii TaxID=390850 RepID=A0A6V7WHK9_MELEN|nr:unnamed protein product [Meloidogyne enterolobii]